MCCCAGLSSIKGKIDFISQVGTSGFVDPTYHLLCSPHNISKHSNVFSIHSNDRSDGSCTVDWMPSVAS